MKIYEIPLALVLLYVMVTGLLWVFQGSLIYPARAVDIPAEAPAPFYDFYVTTDDGIKLRGWYKPAAPHMPTIVYFHGNGDNLPATLYYHTLLLKHGFGLLLTSYRGYSNNEGTPTETGLYKDGDAFINALQEAGVAQKDLIIYGFSLGAGVATEMAVRHPPKALVLAAPFSSMTSAAQSRYPFVPVSLLLRDRYDNIGKIGQIKAPVLIVNGRDDDVFPWEEGKRLAAAANPEFLTFKSTPGTHAGFFFDHGGDEIIADWLIDQAAAQ